MATKYNIVPNSKEIEDGYHSTSRRDDSGPCNALQAWYLFLLHPAASIIFVAYMLQLIDGHHFQTGSPSSTFQIESPLYQTQINGLVSLALVMIRLLASACTALLAWRMIFVLLEKQGMTLAELTRMNNYRIPILPRLKKRSQLLWSAWAILLAFFLWPPNFAAPLANSSLAWNPSAKISGSSTLINMPTWRNSSDFWNVRAPEWRMSSLLNAAIMTGTDPGYAFNSSTLPLRRYFQPPENMTNSSLISTTLPYAEFQVIWHDDGEDDLQDQLNNNTFTDFVNPFPGTYTLSRSSGSVILVRDNPYNPNNAYDPNAPYDPDNPYDPNEPYDSDHPYDPDHPDDPDVLPNTPQQAKVFTRERLIAVRVSTYENGTRLENGSFTNADTPCPSISPYFGDLPGLKQFKFYYDVGGVMNDTSFMGADCYLIGNLTTKAGLYAATDCDVLPAGPLAMSATCPLRTDSPNIQEDWIAPVAFEMLSEIMKDTGMADYAQPYMANNLDAYTTGMLTLAYHAAWSSVMNTLGKDNETASFRRAELTVQAGVSRGKLYAWLAMNLSLLVAAVLMYVALSFSSVKAIRDTTLAPLMADFSTITNSQRGDGLRDAAALSEKDHKLPRIRLCGDGTYNFADEIGIQAQDEKNDAV